MVSHPTVPASCSYSLILDEKEKSRQAKKAAEEQSKKDRDERLKKLQQQLQNRDGAGQAGSGSSVRV